MRTSFKQELLLCNVSTASISQEVARTEISTMGTSSSRNNAFSNMNEDQPLTPSPPKTTRHSLLVHRHIDQDPSSSLLTPCKNGGSSRQPSVVSSCSSQALKDMLEDDVLNDAEGENTKPTDANKIKSTAKVSPTKQLDAFAVSEKETDLTIFSSSTSTASKPETLLSTQDCPAKKKVKLTSLLRTLSASATSSSSARKAQKSGAVDECRMIVDQQQERSNSERSEVLIEEDSSASNDVTDDVEIGGSASTVGMATDIVDSPPAATTSSSVRKLFGLARRSSASPMGTPSSGHRTTSKYSPISDD